MLSAQTSQGIMARLKAAAVAAGASGREAVFTQAPGNALIGEIMTVAARYGLSWRELFATASAASANTVAGSSPSAFTSPRN